MSHRLSEEVCLLSEILVFLRACCKGKNLHGGKLLIAPAGLICIASLFNRVGCGNMIGYFEHQPVIAISVPIASTKDV
jgi:hypothetical protein